MEIQHEDSQNNQKISLYLKLINKTEHNNLSNLIASIKILWKISKMTNSKNVSFIYKQLDSLRSKLDESKSKYNKYIIKKIDKINSKNSVKIRKKYLSNINSIYTKELKYTSQYLDKQILNIKRKYSNGEFTKKINFSKSKYSKFQTCLDFLKYSKYNFENFMIKKIFYPLFMKENSVRRHILNSDFYIINNLSNKLQYHKYIHSLSTPLDDSKTIENMKNCMYLKNIPKDLKKNLKMIYYNHDIPIYKKAKLFRNTLQQELKKTNTIQNYNSESYTFEIHRISKYKNSFFVFNYYNSNEELVKSSVYSLKNINRSLNIHSSTDYVRNRKEIIYHIINELSKKNANRDILSELHLSLCFEFNCEKLNPYILYMLNEENLIEYSKIYIEQELKHKGTKIPITYYPNSKIDSIKTVNMKCEKEI